jgi:hypothetical protein
VRLAPLFLLLATPAAAADPQPRVKVELSPKDGAWVGERVTLAVTLATPDLFAGAPSFEMPAIPGVVVLPPAGSPVIGSETVGDATFTTQRHEFAVYAQRPGVVRVPAFPIRFESNAGFGTPTVRREVTTPAVSFEAKTPPGAGGLGTVIAARDLKVTDAWAPEPKAAKAGDAFTRTVTVTAGGVPGMVLPPLRLDAPDGLAAYPKPPAVTDRTNRGELTGERVESVTYVCEAPGTVVIPDRTLTWFDLDAKELKTVRLPGRTFSVTADPAAPPDAAPAAAAPAGGGARWWRPFVVVGVVLASGWVLLTRVRPWWARHRAARAESEPAYFARFERACRAHDPHAAYTALLAWLDRLGPLSLAEFAARADDSTLTGVLSDLQDRVYARPGATRPDPRWPARDLAVRAALARRRIRSATRPPGAEGSLPPLNPSR